MFCGFCGSGVGVGERFCGGCGAAVPELGNDAELVNGSDADVGVVDLGVAAGDVGLERWWDGAGWSGLTRPVGSVVEGGNVVDSGGVTPAGWYPDPLQAGSRGVTEPVGAVSVSQSGVVGGVSGGGGVGQQRNAGRSRRVVLVLAVLVVLVGGGVVAGLLIGGASDETVVGPSTSVAVSSTDVSNAAASSSQGSVTSVVVASSTTVAHTGSAQGCASANEIFSDPDGDGWGDCTKPTGSSNGDCGVDSGFADEDGDGWGECIEPTYSEPETWDQHEYFISLGDWSTLGARRMQDASVPGSPAWAYARHLEQGFRAGASREGIAGVSNGTADGVDLCIGSSCFQLGSIEYTGSTVTSFAVNGTEIRGLARGWTTGNIVDCWSWLWDYLDGCYSSDSVSMSLTSIYRYGKTTYVSVEVASGVDSGSQISLADAVISGVEGMSFLNSSVTEVVGVGDTEVWVLVFGEVDVDALSSIEVVVSDNGVERSAWFYP